MWPRATPTDPDRPLLPPDAFAGDPRLTPPDIPFTRMQVSAGVVAIRRAPAPDAEMHTQALGGETLRVFREDGEFALVQTEGDGYVGWALMEALSAPVLAATHRVSALRTYVFSEASIKSAPHFMLCLNARLSVEAEEGRFLRLARFGYVVREHAAALDAPFEADPAGVALRYEHTPYLWGGKESLGLDCSGLTQMAFATCGRFLPRDSDMQARLAGELLPEADALASRRRNDLVFWKGHVGILADADTLVHANAFHMRVAVEPWAQALDRIGPPTAIRRLP
jgi:cell wall-associated NlpC family hydrolase